MAILVQPRFHYLTHTSPNPTYRLRTRPHRSSVAVASMPSKRARMESSAGRDTGAAVLWFKHDLRLDDHPGLAAASRCRTVVPLYVFDRRILSRFSDETLEVLLLALEDLRKSLKDQGSDLVITDQVGDCRTCAARTCKRGCYTFGALTVRVYCSGMKRKSSTIHSFCYIHR